jgi:hypothetical protein
MKHSAKLKMARKMMTPLEIKLGVSPFDCNEWKKRKASKVSKVISEYMASLGRKGGKMNTKENMDKARARSLEVRRANKLAKEVI